MPTGFQRYDAPVTSEPHTSVDAVQDFLRARRRAGLAEVLAALSGREAPLLSYDEVRRRLHAVETPTNVLEDVPLDAIVGSVGRTQDFTREFLPRTDADKARWVGVRMAMTGLAGTPPVDLYRIGDAYFVRDGNHRVSVARQLGAKFIQAYVTPVHARVPLAADASPDDLIVAEEHAAFLERTELDRLRPEADVRTTIPGSFARLLEHIDVHRYFMGLDQDREVPYPEAVAHWYDAIYVPVVERVRARALLRGFEGRTETDLYLWLSEHRGKLIDDLGVVLPPESVAEAVGRSQDERGAGPSAARDAVLESVARRRGDADEAALADDVLVQVHADPAAWAAVDQALAVATRERSRLYAVHVVASAAEAEGPTVAALRARFDAACSEAEVAAQFTVAVGAPIPALLARAAWMDLVVAPVLLPSGVLAPGVMTLLRRSPCAVMAVPAGATELAKGLVAYDGGPRSQAALFAGAYLAAKRDLPLVVLTVADLARTAAATLGEARTYLERHGVTADYVERSGPVAEAIVATAEERGCDLILMGSHRYARWLETVLGGVLERVLRSSKVPVLVT